MTIKSLEDFNALEDLVKAVDSFILLLGKNFKDGVSLSDFIDIMSQLASDPIYKKVFDEYKEFSPEIKNMDLPEGIKLMLILLSGIPRYIEAFKNEAH